MRVEPSLVKSLLATDEKKLCIKCYNVINLLFSRFESLLKVQVVFEAKSAVLDFFMEVYFLWKFLLFLINRW